MDDNRRPVILLIEPFFTGSHASWAFGYKEQSELDVRLLTLEGRHWKWRMHGGAVALAEMFLASDLEPDLILATDMLDLTTFLSLTRHRTALLPTAIYFHENQLSYPWSPRDPDPSRKRDIHYGFINFTSALAADVVCFNSRYHQEDFLSHLEPFLRMFPDHRCLKTIPGLEEKCRVLPLGLELRAFDDHRPPDLDRLNYHYEIRGESPLILWNHRWEYDKNPEDFFAALFSLVESGLDFRVAVIGNRYREEPPVFRQARDRLGSRVVQFGPAASFPEYAAWLWQADILPVTSNQDFFGASLLESIHCRCFPLLPRRLSYPELIPSEYHTDILYTDLDDLVCRLKDAVDNGIGVPAARLRDIAADHDWSVRAAQYDGLFKYLIHSKH